jgi:broad specificity phosphatase PhoE
MIPKTILYLIRHGEVENPKDILYMRLPGYPLSTKGKKQVEQQGERIKADAKKRGGVAVIYYSPLLRTKQTAEILMQVLRVKKIRVDERLIDVKTPLEGKITFENFFKDYKGFLYQPELITAGGEPMEKIWKRMKAVGDEILEEFEGKAVVLVSHGDPIELFKLGYQGVKVNKVTPKQLHGKNFPVKGSVTRLEFEGRKLKKVDYWPPEEAAKSNRGKRVRKKK